MEKEYLVTGGGGFIGSNICRRLVELGKGVRVIDNFSTGRRENLISLASKLDIVEGDIRDVEVVRKAMKGIKFVLHQAAIPSVPRSITDPLTTHNVNTTGTLVILKEAVDAGVQRLVSASSSSIYGDQKVLPKQEDMPPIPLSPYALTKLVGEQYCQIFSNLFGLVCVSLRYFNVFGPHQDPASAYAAVVPVFISAFQSGRSPQILGSGLQTRDFTYIDNVVEANLAACHKEGVRTSVLNIGTGLKTSVLDLARIIRQLTGSGSDPIFMPIRVGDVLDSVASIERARQVIGYEPAIDLREGLKRTVKWFSTATR